MTLSVEHNVFSTSTASHLMKAIANAHPAIVDLVI
jgi:hypothetical protein